LTARAAQRETTQPGLEKSVVIVIVFVESAQEENIRMTGLGRIIGEVQNRGVTLLIIFDGIAPRWR
jgi:hypothetical protein